MIGNAFPDADGEEEGEEDEDEEEEDSGSEDEGPGLSALYNDHLEDDEECTSFSQ
jgi:hypothetical protein